MSLRRPFAALAAATILSFATAAAASPWGLAPGEFYSELSGSFYSANTFYNDAEDRGPFWGTLEERVARSHNEFGWRKWATLTLDVPFVSRTFAPDPGTAVTSTGLGDIGLGLRVPMHLGKAPLAFEIGFTLPLGTNRALFPGTSGSGGLNGEMLYPRSSVPLSDTSTFFSQGLTTGSLGLEFGSAIGKSMFWTAGGTYRTTFLSIANRDSADRFADFAGASVGLGWWLTSNVLASGELRGDWQVDQGTSYDRLGFSHPELESKRLLAGPRLTYRVDDRMDVFAGSWHTPGGRNVLHHDLYYCGIAWKHTGLDRLAGALGGTKAH
jgi:hypothetical protein